MSIWFLKFFLLFVFCLYPYLLCCYFFKVLCSLSTRACLLYIIFSFLSIPFFKVLKNFEKFWCALFVTNLLIILLFFFLVKHFFLAYNQDSKQYRPFQTCLRIIPHFQTFVKGFFVIFRVHDITIAYYTFKKLYNEDFVLYRSYYFAQQSKLPLPAPCSSYTLCKIYYPLHTVDRLFIKFSQFWNA